MLIYSINVVAIVILSSIILVYLLKRNSNPDTRIVFAIGVSSIAVSILFPLTFSKFYNIESLGVSGWKIVQVLLSTFVVHLVLIFIFSILISFAVSENKLINILNLVDFKKVDFRKLLKPGKSLNETSDMIPDETVDETADETAYEIADETADETKTEDGNVAPDENNPEEEIGDLDQSINLSEKAVDSEKNVDRMKKGTFEGTELAEEEAVGKQPNEGLIFDLSLEECLEEAFGHKDVGNFEEALNYFIYALDKSPDDDTAFWIITDICALYKALGKKDLAKEILDTYAQSFDNVIDDAVRLEIEKNL